LAKLPVSLRSISIINCHFNNVTLKHLSTLPNLEKLELEPCTYIDIKALSEFGNRAMKLKTLSLGKITLQREKLMFISFLQKVRLNNLCLKQCDIASMRDYAPFLQSLKSLILIDCGAVEHLKELSKATVPLEIFKINLNSGKLSEKQKLKEKIQNWFPCWLCSDQK